MPVVLNGQKMKEFRTARGLSVEKVAIDADVTARCIRDWEDKTPNVNENIAKAVAKRLGVKLDAIKLEGV